MTTFWTATSAALRFIGRAFAALVGLLQSSFERVCRSPRPRVYFEYVALAALIAFLAFPRRAQAQASCGDCWAGVTQWHGTWSLTLVGTGLNDSSQGTFDISNGVYSITGSGSVSGNFQTFCSMSGSGALDPSSSVQMLIDPTNCTYSWILNDRINYVDTTANGPMNAIETCSGNTVAPAGLIPESVLPYFPLPAYGESLVESGSYSASFPGLGCYGFQGGTLTISWTIDPVVPSGPPKFTHIPVGGDLGCNPADTPDVGSVLDDTDATAPSGQVSISALPVYVTNGCNVTASFTLTAKDDCTEQTINALVVYSWSEDTDPPVIAGVPAGGNLGCNPANKPTDASVMVTLAITDNCSVATTNVTHVDLTNGCTVTRTFTITAEDACGNVSPAKTAVFTWTMDTKSPVITGTPGGGTLGCNPNNPPTDASVAALVQATDDCGVASMNVSHTDNLNGCAMTRTFTITATDNCGNVSAASTATYTWTVDTTPPTFTQLPPGGYLGTNPPCIPDDGAVQALAQADDNCGVASVAAGHTDSGNSNLFTRTFTITATDNCGNQAMANVAYTWSGTAGTNNSAPVLSILELGSNTVLFWPTNADCFCLVSRTSLVSGFWTAVTNVPAVQSNRFTVTNGAVGPIRFYRLAK